MGYHTLIVYVLQRLTTFISQSLYSNSKLPKGPFAQEKKKRAKELEIRVVKKIPGKQRFEKLEKE